MEMIDIMINLPYTNVAFRSDVKACCDIQHTVWLAYTRCDIVD